MPLILYSKDAPKTLPYIIDDKDPSGILSLTPYQPLTYEWIPKNRTSNYDTSAGGVITPDDDILIIPYGTNTSSSSCKAYLLDTEEAVCNPLAGGEAAQLNRWAGGCLAEDGNIYAAPYNTANILKFDPVTKLLTKTTEPFVTNAGYYYGCVAHPNGKIYFAPAKNLHLTEYDPATDDVRYIQDTYLKVVSGDKYRGGVLHPNGCIYFAPGTTNKILKYNPETDTISYIASGAGYRSAVLAPNGKIYFIPGTNTRICELDVETNTVNFIGSFGTSEKWYGGCLAPNGRIYFVSGISPIYEFNPETRTGQSVLTELSISNFFNGIIAHPNGKLYCIPNNSPNILVIDTHCIPKNPSACRLPYFNKL